VRCTTPAVPPIGRKYSIRSGHRCKAPLEKLHAPHLELKALAGTLDPLLVFADKRKLLSSSPPKLTKAITTAATKKLERAINDALDAAVAAAARPAPEPCSSALAMPTAGWRSSRRSRSCRW
jgi:hypothetical protein